MKYFFTLLLLLSLGAGCKDIESPEVKLEKKLMQTMKEYLDQSAKLDVQVTVKDVIYDERKDHYYCEFHVNLHSPNKDTTGTMVALISKDFKKVDRSQ